jgi:hypothetical protein
VDGPNVLTILFCTIKFQVKLDLDEAFSFKSKYGLDQCFFWGMNFHNLLRKKEGTEHFCLEKKGPKSPHYEGKKKSKVAIFRE